MGTTERRFVGVVFFSGAAFAMVGNVLHPFFPLRISPQEFLTGVQEASGIWWFLHLCLVFAGVLIAAGVVMVVHRLAGTPGDSVGRFAGVMAIIGGILFVLWQGLLDGIVFSALADEFAATPDDAALLATATGMLAMENGLGALSILLFNGAAVLAGGLAFYRSGVFAPWIQWTLIVAGAAAIVVGMMMFVGLFDAATFWLFRAAGLVQTLVLFGVGLQLFRGTAGTALIAERAA